MGVESNPKLRSSQKTCFSPNLIVHLFLSNTTGFKHRSIYCILMRKFLSTYTTTTTTITLYATQYPTHTPLVFLIFSYIAYHLKCYSCFSILVLIFYVKNMLSCFSFNLMAFFVVPFVDYNFCNNASILNAVRPNTYKNAN